MIAEEYALLNGPLDGCAFSLEEDAISGAPAVMALPGQDALWLVASFDEGGKFVRFLIGERHSAAWNVHQYREGAPGRYAYAGVLVRSDGRTTGEEIMRKLKEGS
jgi:hypothetical protein